MFYLTFIFIIPHGLPVEDHLSLGITNVKLRTVEFNTGTFVSQPGWIKDSTMEQISHVPGDYGTVWMPKGVLH